MTRRTAARPRLELLEDRLAPAALTPAQVRQAYGFDQLKFGSIAADGRGQTVAIVVAYDAPTVEADLRTFSRQFGLPDASFTKVRLGGVTATDAEWAHEAALDVQWVHAIAPAAKIVLVEAPSASAADLSLAAEYAAKQPGVSVVSMSFGGWEFAGQTNYDRSFRTPANHAGVTFVAASGDTGRPNWPGSAPGVVSVGGTALRLTSQNNWSRESAWGDSGGGLSRYALATPEQQRASGTVQRAAPDVAYNADPMTGVAVYNSFQTSGSHWFQVGGTSAGAPQWAALFAIANQGRALANKGPLDGQRDTLPALYQMPATAFRDITSGHNGVASAKVGYDRVTGRGTPRAGLVVPQLVNYAAPSAPLAAPPPPVKTSGGSGALTPQLRPLAVVQATEPPTGATVQKLAAPLVKKKATNLPQTVSDFAADFGTWSQS